GRAQPLDAPETSRASASDAGDRIPDPSSWHGGPANAGRAMNPALQQTAAAILVPRDIKALSAAAAAELWRSATKEQSAMDSASLARLFASLDANRFGWCVRLPAELGALFGLQIDLVFQTRVTVDDNPPPPVRDNEKELAHAILRNL